MAATTAASIYALPPGSRAAGAHLAHDAGHWVHADIILTNGPDGGVENRGVQVAELQACQARVPQCRLDVHLMVVPGTRGWRQHVAALAGQLREVRVRRWTASLDVLEQLTPHLGADPETWVEIWPPRDGAGHTAGHGGALVMLIEPGTSSAADPAANHVVACLAPHRPVGVDGGVTQDVASRVIAAGASYLVIGRALFEWAT
ncbi:MAG: hypothetical protein ACK5KO_11075 [Arachnia sp.]